MDPLAQLKDIHLPEQINNYPTAYGWWILACIIIALCIWAIRKVVKKRQLEKVKKLAIKQVSSHNLSNTETLSVMKWAALQYFPRDQVASLFGENLHKFYLERLSAKYHDNFSQMIESTLVNQYTNSIDAQEGNVKQATLLWLTHALPPKSKIIEQNTNADAAHANQPKEEVA